MTTQKKTQDLRDVISSTWRSEQERYFVYHGTNSAALPKIQRYGLVPGMNLYDLKELRRLVTLMKKAGCSHPIGFWFENQGQHISFTTVHELAVDYARNSPEFWSQLITPTIDTNPTENKHSSELRFRTICAKLCGDQHGRLTQVTKSQLLLYVKEHSTLSTEEINQALAIYTRLDALYASTSPVVLHISLCAPNIAEYYIGANFEEFLIRFLIYLNVVHRYSKRNNNWEQLDIITAERTVKEFFAQEFKREIMKDTNVKTDKRIPPKYILKYEEV